MRLKYATSNAARGMRSERGKTRACRMRWFALNDLISYAMIAILDVHYHTAGARASGVLVESWSAGTPAATVTEDVAAVEPYESGNFYRRELPCLLAVLRRLSARPEAVVIDGYVWLPPDGRPGLGARLYDALEQATPVVGVAKTAFRGAESCAWTLRVYRGASGKPLFVTAAGMAPDVAARLVRGMAGPYRIPDAVRLADRLARSGLESGGAAA